MLGREVDTHIPCYPDAVQQLRGLLDRFGYSSAELLWVSRDDFYAVSFGWYYLAPHIPNDTEELLARYFERGRKKGLVSLDAIFYLPGQVGCTIWFPERPEEEVQGWSTGLKVGVRTPLGIASQVASSAGWRLHRLRPSYRRFQRMCEDVPTRGALRPNQALQPNSSGEA